MRGSVLRDKGGILVITGAVIIVFVATGGVSSAGATPVGSTSDAPESLFASVAPVSGYDTIAVHIRIDRDGTAHWQVGFRYELEDQAVKRAFQRASRNITNPPGEFITLMNKEAVGPAEAQTGRSMRLLNGSVETSRSVPDGRFGIVRYRFQWTNFAAESAEDRVVVDDVIGGYRLGKNETLMIEWTDGLRKVSVTPDPDVSQAKAVRWTGPMQFRTVDPTVKLEVSGSGPNGLSFLPVVVAIGLLLAVGTGWYGRSRRRSSEEEGDTDTGHVPTEPSDDLLSDEERVLRLLEERGGRMKQQELIEAVEWSRTKASDVVNEMHEAEQIEKFQLGRENVLTLPGEIEI